MIPKQTRSTPNATTIQLQHKPTLDVLDNFGLLLVGPPKSGKTTTCLGFEQPIAVLDCDNNFAGPLQQMRAREPDFDYFRVDPNYKYDEHGNKLEARTMHERWDAAMQFMKLASNHPDIRTIVIDSLSPLTEYLMAKILFHAKGEKHQTLKIGNMDLMAMAHWQPFKNYMTAFVTAGRTSGKTFIITCHEDTLMSEQGAVIGYRPMIPGSLKNNLAGFFSDVWRCQTTVKMDKPQYSIRVAPKNLHQIGNSLGIKETELSTPNKTPTEIWKMLAPFFGKDVK